MITEDFCQRQQVIKSGTFTLFGWSGSNLGCLPPSSSHGKVKWSLLFFPWASFSVALKCGHVHCLSLETWLPQALCNAAVCAGEGGFHLTSPVPLQPSCKLGLCPFLTVSSSSSECWCQSVQGQAGQLDVRHVLLLCSQRDFFNLCPIGNYYCSKKVFFCFRNFCLFQKLTKSLCAPTLYFF